METLIYTNRLAEVDMPKSTEVFRINFPNSQGNLTENGCMTLLQCKMIKATKTKIK